MTLKSSIQIIQLGGASFVALSPAIKLENVSATLEVLSLPNTTGKEYCHGCRSETEFERSDHDTQVRS